jgi:hypothetical protein
VDLWPERAGEPSAHEENSGWLPIVPQNASREPADADRLGLGLVEIGGNKLSAHLWLHWAIRADITHGRSMMSGRSAGSKGWKPRSSSLAG